MPRLTYFFAFATTSRRLADVRCSRADAPCASRTGVMASISSTSLPASSQRADRRQGHVVARPRPHRDQRRALADRRPQERAVDPGEDRDGTPRRPVARCRRRGGCGPLEQLVRPRRSRRADLVGQAEARRGDEQVERRRRTTSAAATIRPASVDEQVVIAGMLRSCLRLGVVHAPRRGGRGSAEAGSLSIRWPSSIVFASITSSSAVRRGTRAISRR